MKKLFSVFVVTVLMFYSCEENDSNPNLENNVAIESIDEYAMVSQIFQDIGNTSGDMVLSAEDFGSENKGVEKWKSGINGKGPLITVSPADFQTFPKTITIDFGSGILGKDGITRKGVVKIISTDWYRNHGSEHTTTFYDFYHETFQVKGSHFVKNLGTNVNDHLHFSVKIDDGKIIDKEGETINYTESSIRTWIAGHDSPMNIWDDEYLLEGQQSGISSKGVTYKLSIQEALHFVLLPRSIKSGIVDIEIGKLSDITLNFTDSTITILGISYPFNSGA